MSFRQNQRSCKGFTLIELMVGMVIGLFLIAGVFTVYINGKESQRAVDDQILMIDNARFALEAIGADLRQAGVWGRVKNDSSRVTGVNVAVTSECAPGWATDIDQPFYVFNDTDPYGAPCINQYSVGDIVEMRYALRDAIEPPASVLQADEVYINSDVNQATFFVGNTSPAISAAASDYPYVARAYYLSTDSDTVGDGVRSLHRVSLQPGPAVVDELMLAGVDDLQIQIGLDNLPAGAPDGVVDTYVNPANGIDWTAAKSVQIWVVVRSERTYNNVAPFSANIAGNMVTYPDDGFRRVMASAVVYLRNI
jgi:type IV pilus assembly protein PilW